MSPPADPGMTRRGLLAVAAALAASASAPGLAPAAAQSGGGDPDLLNLLMTLELLQTRLYGEGLDRVPDLTADARATLQMVHRQELAHTAALTKLLTGLGGTPVPDAQVDFGDAFGSSDAFFGVVAKLEDTAVSAGNGVLSRLASRRAIEVVGSLVGVEAAQAATVRLLAGQPAADGSFDRLLSQSSVVKRLDPFLPEGG